MSEYVECEIPYNDIIDMCPPIPFAIQIRQRLNREGFKFKDDGQLSAIINERPEPLGLMLSRQDYNTRSFHYKQILTETSAPQDEENNNE